MLEFLKQIFVSARTFFSCYVLNVNSLKQVSMSNQECTVSSEILTTINLYFIVTAFLQINAVVVIIISLIHTQSCVLLKI